MTNKTSPFLKAIIPALGTLAAVVVQWAINGTFDKQTATIAATGLIASIVTYFVPNAARPAPQAEPSVGETVAGALEQEIAAAIDANPDLMKSLAGKALALTLAPPPAQAPPPDVYLASAEARAEQAGVVG